VILEELVLHDFGVYAARQTLALAPPDPSRPITLVGGLNGSGKTSLLDALLLALYGPLAPLAARRGLSYEAYLRRMIHRAAPIPEAAVELAFKTYRGGSEDRYRIKRVWRASKNGGVAERLEILRNGHLDRQLSETWPEHVETFIPRGVAPFFFFDAEQLETFADVDKAREVLRTAIGALLGLDLVQKLFADLLVLERRKALSLGTSATRSEIDSLQGRLEELRRTEERTVHDLAAAQVRLERCTKHLRDREDRFRLDGGELFHRRKQIEDERDSILTRMRLVDDELRDAAAGAACLLLAADLIPQLRDQLESDQERRHSDELFEILEARDSRLREHLRSLGLPSEALELVEKALGEESKRFPRLPATTTFALPAETLSALRDIENRVLPELRVVCESRLTEVEQLQQALDDAERSLGAVPAPEAIAELERHVHEGAGHLTAAREAHLAAEQRLLDVRKEIADRERRLSRVVESVTREALDGADSQRVIRYSQRVRETLAHFERRATAYHTRRIEEFILQALSQLFRKDNLITHVRIDPETFVLELHGSQGVPMSADELSAGERQLLATGVLWGLAKAAGRPLPVVIDTPLGRLDTIHRTYLIERYFPQVSHQVIILSTDDEIDATAYRQLERHVGRTYRLDFQGEQEATKVLAGYFG
jgi:DNA sulfur modification protein DndD